MVETGPQPHWRENFSVELPRMSELRAELYSHADTELRGMDWNVRGGSTASVMIKISSTVPPISSPSPREPSPPTSAATSNRSKPSQSQTYIVLTNLTNII